MRYDPGQFVTDPLVLIADNDRAVSALLVEVLARHGLRTVCAYDGEAASELLLDRAVAVFVCDLDMPRRNGLEVLEELSRRVHRPPTVVVTGYLDAAVRQRLEALPFVRGTMRKPFDLFAFARQVRDLAGAAEGPRQAGAEH